MFFTPSAVLGVPSVFYTPKLRRRMATTTRAAEEEREEEHATGTDTKDDERAAFLQASATLLLNISPPLESSLQPRPVPTA